MWRPVFLIFLGVFGYLSYQLIYGEQGIKRQEALAKQIQYQENQNQRLSQRNDALRAQVENLRKGKDAIEERVRTELQYIKEGEVFYRIVDQ
ncbi:septum formation initiator family protein [Marinomonas sp. 15G1-11]|uniref:Cell division protein FtsB n=1 Tax=Marinomonas phaeophyticola TaxID=3004091 RepID=A0ABT4JUL3_9GAMM|nr:septum formation initiator family protein [Marinomonas sp. 15G1-11]MCZ2721727.1 septum formation initiator family protein [Marinomonas sp. 15G1-11]